MPYQEDEFAKGYVAGLTGAPGDFTNLGYLHGRNQRKFYDELAKPPVKPETKPVKDQTPEPVPSPNGPAFGQWQHENELQERSQTYRGSIAVLDRAARVQSEKEREARNITISSEEWARRRTNKEYGIYIDRTYRKSLWPLTVFMEHRYKQHASIAPFDERAAKRKRYRLLTQPVSMPKYEKRDIKAKIGEIREFFKHHPEVVNEMEQALVALGRIGRDDHRAHLFKTEWGRFQAYKREREAFFANEARRKRLRTTLYVAAALSVIALALLALQRFIG